MKKWNLVLLLIFLSNLVNAQVGGRSVYSFLNVSSSARITAMGGALIADSQADQIALALQNPAQLNRSSDGQLSFQHQFFPAGVQAGYAGYGKYIGKRRIMAHGSVNYMLYGQFDETDIYGNILGTFKGNDLALQFGASYQLYDKMSVGANVKFIQSNLDVYRSSGLAIDLGALYCDTLNLFTAALVIKQSGLQLSTYDEVREPLPLDIQIGVSKRLRHLPFHFFVTYHHFNRWNLLFDDPDSEEDFIFGGFQTLENNPTKIDNFFRHFIVGGEMSIGKKKLVKLRLGYNHQLKQELSVTTQRSLAGFSVGFGVRVKRFQFDYGNTKMHLGGSTHHIGLTTNLKYFTGSGIVVGG